MSDSPSVELALVRLKQLYDRQAIMAIGGMVLVSAFFVLDFHDYARTVETLKRVLPWFAGLAILVFALNRWTLRIQSRAVRRHHQQTRGA